MTVLEDAERAGFDLSLIKEGLRRSYDERAAEHQAALELALELEMIGRNQRESAQPTTADTLRR
jgi:hypothetical protein